MRRIHLLPLLLLCTLLAACGGGNIPCPFGPDDLGSSPGDVTLTIENQACTTVCQVFLGAPSCDDWGLTLLGEETLQHGSSVSYQIPPGKYDLLIVECTEDSYQMTKLDLREGDTLTYNLKGQEAGAACEASLTVVNKSSTPICNMWIAGPQSESFGYNWLGTDVIPAGESMTFPVFPGTYDLKAEDCDFNPLRIEMDHEITDNQTWNVP